MARVRIGVFRLSRLKQRQFSRGLDHPLSRGVFEPLIVGCGSVTSALTRQREGLRQLWICTAITTRVSVPFKTRRRSYVRANPNAMGAERSYQ